MNTQMFYSIILIAAAVAILALVIIIPTVAVKRHKHKKEIQRKLEAALLRDAYKPVEAPDLSKLTVIALDEHDPLLDNFPYIKSMVSANYLSITRVKMFLDDRGAPIYAIASVSDTAFITEQRVNGYTDVTYTDTSNPNEVYIHLNTEHMFRR